MTNSQAFKLAHKMTKQVIKSGDNYQATFGQCLKVVNAQNVKMNTLQVILIILFALVTVITKQVKQVSLPTQKGSIVYANKEGDKVAFEVTTISNNGFVAKDLYNRQITIFKLVNNKLVSSNGYEYNEQASKAWLAMFNAEQARIAA